MIPSKKKTKNHAQTAILLFCTPLEILGMKAIASFQKFEKNDEDNWLVLLS